MIANQLCVLMIYKILSLKIIWTFFHANKSKWIFKVDKIMQKMWYPLWSVSIWTRLTCIVHRVEYNLFYNLENWLTKLSKNKRGLQYTKRKQQKLNTNNLDKYGDFRWELNLRVLLFTTKTKKKIKQNKIKSISVLRQKIVWDL